MVLERFSISPQLTIFEKDFTSSWSPFHYKFFPLLAAFPFVSFFSLSFYCLKYRYYEIAKKLSSIPLTLMYCLGYLQLHVTEFIVFLKLIKNECLWPAVVKTLNAGSEGPGCDASSQHMMFVLWKDNLHLN